jgi:hypothetical protein
MARSELPAPYQVDYSGAVRQHFRLLAREAAARGDGQAFAAALKEFHRRLMFYPQFGDPLIDLAAEPGQIRLGIIRPLSMRYGVFEERRLVVCGTLPILLPMDKPESEGVG